MVVQRGSATANGGLARIVARDARVEEGLRF